jgi:hypothetical protein
MRWTFPAIGRVLFKEVAFTSSLRVDRFAYAIDRTYGISSIESPRIFYRRGTPPVPVVLGDTLGNTDGLILRLNSAALDAVTAGALGIASALRGELIIRALRRFIVREGRAGSFQAERLRKVVLAAYLDAGGTLASLDTDTIRAVVSALTNGAYDAIATSLSAGLHAGDDPAEAARAIQVQKDWYDDTWSQMQEVQANISKFDDAYVSEAAKDLLVHTVAVTVLDGLSRLVGAVDGEVAYFHNTARNEIYIFDGVEGGNGCAETIARFCHIPPLRRILAARSGTSDALPSSDGFMLVEETLASCPAQASTRLLFEACMRGVASPADLRFPSALYPDLEARIRHEYDPIVGAHGIVAHLIGSEPTLFAEWTDLLWLQLVPERFADSLVNAGICSNTTSLRSRSHVCVTGCLDCVDSGDVSIYGALSSREHVSRNLLDAFRRHMLATEPNAFVPIPPGTPISTALQANAARPVTDATGAPVSIVIDEGGTTQQVLLTQVLSTVSPDFGLPGGGPLLSPAPSGGWDVHIPFLAAYRDERPML